MVVLFVEYVLLVVISLLFLPWLLLNRLLGGSRYYIMRGLSQFSVQLVKLSLIDLADFVVLIILKVFSPILLLLLDSVPQVILPEGIPLPALFHLPILLSSSANGTDLVSLCSSSTRYDLRVLVEDT